MSESRSGIAVDLQGYINTHVQLKNAVEGLPKERLTWKEADDKWSVTEVLTHLADHNLVVSFRIREILSGSTERLPPFNQDSWVSGQKANQSDATDVLDHYEALLVYNLKLFNRLSDDDWNKTGVNFKGETVSLSDIVHSFVAHVQRHLGQIERIKASAATGLQSNM